MVTANGTPRLFFVHVMKCAGTSVTRRLRPLFAAERRDEGWDAKADIGRLLAMDPSPASRFDFLAPHMPAWVAEHVAPDHIHITLLRDPVERTISHLHQLSDFDDLPEDLDELFSIPAVRDRLGDYQTRFFAASFDDHMRHVELTPAAADAGDVDRVALATALGTAVPTATPLTKEHLATAQARLSSFDVIGDAHDLGSFADRLRVRTGLDVGTFPHANRRARADDVSPSLRQAIIDANPLDLAFYAFATELMSEEQGD